MKFLICEFLKFLDKSININDKTRRAQLRKDLTFKRVNRLVQHPFKVYCSPCGNNATRTV